MEEKIRKSTKEKGRGREKEGKERKGKERKGKERKGKERKGKNTSHLITAPQTSISTGLKRRGD